MAATMTTDNNEKQSVMEATPTASEAVGDKVIDLQHVPSNKIFSPLSTLALVVSLMATWEGLLSTLGAGLASGGPVSLIYGFIVAFIGSLATALSLSEPASMFPRAGGQYNMVAELAPARYRAVSSWFCTYLTVLGWIAFTASVPFLGGSLIQGLIILNNPDYTPERWHGSCLFWAIVLLAFVVNVWGYRFLHTVSNVMMVLHVVFFIIVLVVVTVMPPQRNTAAFVFTEFVNLTGWENDGIAWCLGLLTSTYTMVGYDSAMHLSEEMQRPDVGVPRAMVGSMVLNGVMALALLIAVLFGMGDIEAAITTSTNYPIIQMFYFATRGSTVGATLLTIMIIIAASLATMGLIASSSRTIWAAARDGATPFSDWLSQLDSKQEVPRRAVMCTTMFLVLMGLLNIGSTTAFNAILSLTVVALSTSYVLPIIAMLWRRIWTPDQITYGSWKLPRGLGIAANVVSICYIAFCAIFLFFPPMLPVNAVNMNYASLMYGATVLFTTIGWFAFGRRRYSGPKSLQFLASVAS